MITSKLMIIIEGKNRARLNPPVLSQAKRHSIVSVNWNKSERREVKILKQVEYDFPPHQNHLVLLYLCHSSVHQRHKISKVLLAYSKMLRIELLVLELAEEQLTYCSRVRVWATDDDSQFESLEMAECNIRLMPRSSIDQKDGVTPESWSLSGQDTG